MTAATTSSSRLSSGALRLYKPGLRYGGRSRSTCVATSLGTGWNQYDVLTSPGDITGDGRPGPARARGLDRHGCLPLQGHQHGQVVGAGEAVRRLEDVQEGRRRR
ncbi:hypothetical protein ACRAWF_29540 [Streptomyces sp. L7]